MAKNNFKKKKVLIAGGTGMVGQALVPKLLKSGAKIFTHPVKKPHLYGVASLDKNKKVVKLIEKPKKTRSNLAVTGLYFFDNKVIELTNKLKKSNKIY